MYTKLALISLLQYKRWVEDVVHNKLEIYHNKSGSNSDELQVYTNTVFIKTCNAYNSIFVDGEVYAIGMIREVSSRDIHAETLKINDLLISSIANWPGNSSTIDFHLDGIHKNKLKVEEAIVHLVMDSIVTLGKVACHISEALCCDINISYSEMLRLN
ncbi:hypothetical protein [Aquitalea sp. LB_tupeE]|uniref:hypothetical protein n=1 Tax=Aquitalea sp. LB_tupeE TaxID=2748078 RepID=UPI0015C05910|nr:hypothetical protein [Aquitalea sp. LB_tupeE]